MWQRGSSLCVMSWWTSLYLWWEKLLQFLSGSSVIVASDLLGCSNGSIGSSLVALCSGVPLSLWYAGTLLQMRCAGSSVVVTHAQHTRYGQGLSLLALYSLFVVL